MASLDSHLLTANKKFADGVGIAKLVPLIPHCSQDTV